MGAVALLADRVAARAVLPDQNFALVDEGLFGGIGRDGARNEGAALAAIANLTALKPDPAKLRDGTMPLLSCELR